MMNFAIQDRILIGAWFCMKHEKSVTKTYSFVNSTLKLENMMIAASVAKGTASAVPRCRKVFQGIPTRAVPVNQLLAA